MTNEQLVTAIKQGKTEYTAELWQNTYKLIYKLVTEYYNKLGERCQSCGVTLDDMKQESYIAFVGMIEAFNPEKGLKFSSYANFQVKNVVFGMLGFRTDKKRPLNEYISLDEPINGTDDKELTIESSIEDSTAVEAFYAAEDDIFNSELKRAIDKAMSEHLTAFQRDIIHGRFYDNKTLGELADENSVNRERIRAEEGRALRQLRNHNRELASFREHFITDHSYFYTSLGSFRERIGSSQELVIERLEEIAVRK